MRLNDYRFSEEEDRRQWLNSIKMKVGLKYFGGKSVIGRYLFNNIFNMAVQMKKDKRPADILIDAFTGGGKIGLSVPSGWFDTIVINDLDLGVYSYYTCCKENHIALIKMIDEIGKKYMNRDLFHVYAFLRGDNNVELDPLARAAMTFWVTQGAFNGIAAAKKCTYNLTRVKENNSDDKSLEKENIAKAINTAHKRIPMLHNQLNNGHFIIENMDYRDLIKKYNGMPYLDKDGEHKGIEDVRRSNKLYYFDPPYHPAALYGAEEAPYEDTFTYDMAAEMVNILHGNYIKDYGSIDYFIKSDYDVVRPVQEAWKDAGIRNGNKSVIYNRIKGKNDDELKPYEKIIFHDGLNNSVGNVFKPLEKYPFCKICIGSFDKGVINESGNKRIGEEYIWCKGFPKGYERMKGTPAKED